MSRTKKGSKRPGYDYQARRIANRSGCRGPSTRSGSRWQKRFTWHVERQAAERALREELRA